MRTLLVDSNLDLRGELWNLLSMYRYFQMVPAELKTTEEAVDCIASNEVDVVFINNQPADPRYTSQGTALTSYLAHERPDIQVVVYADSADAAYWAYRSQCAGFLLTPIDPLAFQALVNRLTYIYDLQRAKREMANRSIMIKTKSGYQLTRLSDILFIERSSRKNRIVATDGQETVLLGYTMNQLEEMLGGSGFYRCYQSFIVNLAQVSFIRADNDAKNYALRFKDYDGEILLSRNKYTEIVDLLRDRYAKINI